MYKALAVGVSSLLLAGCTFLPQTDTNGTDLTESGTVDTTQQVPTDYTKVKAYPYTCEDGTHISVSEVDDFLYVYVDTYAESFEYIPETNDAGEKVYVYQNSPIYSTLVFAGEGAYDFTRGDVVTTCFAD